MDLMKQASSLDSPAELINALRLLVDSVTELSDGDEIEDHLQRMVVVLRSLRTCAPLLSRQLSDQVKEAIAEIGPAMSIIGTVSAGIGAAVGIAGLFMQVFCKEEDDRRTGREMARVGRAVAVGSTSVVSLINQIVAEIESELPSSSQSPCDQRLGKYSQKRSGNGNRRSDSDWPWPPRRDDW